MKILAIDSTATMCSVALLQQDNIIEYCEPSPRTHSQRLLPMVDQLMKEANVSLKALDAIAFGRGPGSFTGLRIGIGLVQGLALGAELPVVAVSSLAALAQTAFMEQPSLEAHTVFAAIDARMNEVYWQGFSCKEGLATAIDLTPKEQLTAPEEVIERVLEANTVAVGTGWQYHSDDALEPLPYIDKSLLPKASAIAKLGLLGLKNGEAASADQAMPTYVRNEVAWKKRHEQ